MKRKKRMRGRAKTFLIILTLIAVYFVWNVSAKTTKEDISYKEVFVGAGDSMWSIALDNADEDTDIRKYVKQIKDFNGMKTSGLVAYSTIKVPEYQK